jgi:hypothetical protein
LLEENRFLTVEPDFDPRSPPRTVKKTRKRDQEDDDGRGLRKSKRLAE